MSNLTSNLTAKSNKIETSFKKLTEKYCVNSPNNSPEALMKLLDETSIKYLMAQKKYKLKINELTKELDQLKGKVKNMEETEKVIEAVISTSPKKNPKEMQEELEKNKVLVEELSEQTDKYRKALSEIKVEMSKQKKQMKDLQEKHEDIMIQNSELKDDVTVKETKLKMYLDENEKSKNLNKNLTIEIEKLKNTQNSNLFELSSHNLLNSDRRGNYSDYEKKHIEDLSESNEKLGKTVIELKNDINKEKKNQKELKERIEEILMENKELKEDLEIKDGKIKNYLEQLDKLKSIVKNKVNSIEKGGPTNFSLLGERKIRSSNENLAIMIKDENENLKRENLDLKRKLEKKESEIEEKFGNQNNSNTILNSQHNSINESFNEKNYKSKKEEIHKMKEEINRLKEEIASLLRSSNSNTEKPKMKQLQISQKGVNFTISKQDLPGNNYKIFSSDSNVSSELNNKNTESQGNNYAISSRKCQICNQILDQINDLKSSLKQSIFKDMKQFYLNYYSEIEKATVKLNEVTQKFSKAESDFNNENIDKKVKVSQVKDILSTSQKLLSLLTVFFSKYNKDIYFYTQNLKKVFDFSQKLVFTMNTDNLMFIPTNLNLELGSNSNFFKNKPYIITILKFFYEFTKIFNQTDLRKIYPFYENKSIPEIINFYKTQCESLKTNILESRWDYETEFSELDESLIVKPNQRRVSDLNMNHSYKIVNEKIMKLKKLEYDNSNFTEILKHYAIVQELIIKYLYDTNTDIDGSIDSSKLDKMKNKQDALEKVINITEDTLLFKLSELDEDSIQIRRSIIKLLKNQKAILTLSTELL